MLTFVARALVVEIVVARLALQIVIIIIIRTLAPRLLRRAGAAVLGRGRQAGERIPGNSLWVDAVHSKICREIAGGGGELLREQRQEVIVGQLGEGRGLREVPEGRNV